MDSLVLFRGSLPNSASFLYPVQERFAVYGLWAALLAGILFLSPLLSFCFFVLFAVTGLLWRMGEPPIFPFAMAYQWVYVVAPLLYQQATGSYPKGAFVGDLEGAVLLSMLGFLALAAGIRSGLSVYQSRVLARKSELLSCAAPYSLPLLFWCTVLVYGVHWFLEVSPMALYFNAAQILYAVLSFRDVLLVVLWYTILRRGEGYPYGIAAVLFVLIPRLASVQSSFKEVFFILIVVLASEWRPWRAPFQGRRNARLVAAMLAIILGLLYLGIVWEGAVKPTIRTAGVQGSPLEKVETFYQLTAQPIASLDLATGFELLTARMSSATFFSHVLERVPAAVPHEGGQLSWRALLHVLTPRILFPEKENLGGDSWIATRYAGLMVGPNTSVGIGYMAEFYVDFGRFGMFLPLLFYGALLGITYNLFFLVSPSYDLLRSVLIIPYINNFLTFDGHFAKLLGGLLTNVMVFVMVLVLVGLLSNRKHSHLEAVRPA